MQKRNLQLTFFFFLFLFYYLFFFVFLIILYTITILIYLYNIGTDETSSLIKQQPKKMRINDVEKNVNLLYIPMMTDGYIVVFDVQSTDSLSKAKALIKAIHQR